MELALDTSTDVSGLALSRDGQVLVEMAWLSGQDHARQLFPALEALLERGGVGLEQVRTVFVALGPGSFNGLRVGLAAAKGLALAIGAHLVGISTLEIEAFPFRSAGLPLCAVHGAGRGELAVALFQQSLGRWERLWEDQLISPQELLSRLPKKALFCGEIPSEFLAQLGAWEGEATIPSPAARRRRPAFLAELGWLRLQERGPDPAAGLQPVYLRRPPITQPKEERHAR
jgi:tRNA threonylcarbamoyladenosine biosynthesis protein TsaB